MWPVVHGIGPGERTGLARERRDALRVGEGADRIGGEWERDHARTVGELPLEVVHVQAAVIVDVDEAHGQALVVRELDPGGDVAVVVEARDQDLVAGLERAADRPREGEVQRGHVRPEDDLLVRAAEEARRARPRLVEQHLGTAARLVGPADVRVRLAQVGADGVDHRVGHLRPAGAVEEDEFALERREPGASALEIERRRDRRAHVSLPLTRQA